MQCAWLLWSQHGLNNNIWTLTFFVLNDEKGDNWLWINIYVEDTLTEYALQFEDAPVTEYFSEVLFYPLPSNDNGLPFEGIKQLKGRSGC